MSVLINCRFLSFVVALILVTGFDSNELSGQEKNGPVKTPPGEKKIKSFSDLVQAFERQKLEITINEKSNSLYLPTRVGDVNTVMVVRWDTNNGVFHLIHTMPLRVPEDKTDQYLRAAQTLNHGFIYPGIGINLEKGTAYYRMTIPLAPRGYIRDYELGAYSVFVKEKTEEFFPTLKAFMAGKVSVDEISLYHRKRLLALQKQRSTRIRLMAKYERTIKDAVWTLDFSKANTLRVNKDGKLVVESSLKFAGKRCIIEDTKGELASTGIGTYELITSPGKLSFRAESDLSNQRKSVLSGGVWSGKK